MISVHLKLRHEERTKKEHQHLQHNEQPAVKFRWRLVNECLHPGKRKVRAGVTLLLSSLFAIFIITSRDKSIFLSAGSACCDDDATLTLRLHASPRVTRASCQARISQGGTTASRYTNILRRTIHLTSVLRVRLVPGVQARGFPPSSSRN